MTAQQIADLAEGLIMLSVGVSGLTVFKEKFETVPFMKKMRKPLSIILIVIGVIFTVKPLLFGQERDLESYTLEQINRSIAGTFIDEDETLKIDSISIGRNRELIGNYSFTDVASTDADDEYRKILYGYAMEYIFGSPQYKKFIEKEYTVLVRFYGSDGGLITEVKKE